MPRRKTLSNHFHCYLLHSLSPRHPHKTYIGFTTNPYRRLKQHNGILKNGGARRTARSGRPWQFVTVVYGFTDKITALQFEWAWQHPHKSRLVRDVLGEQQSGIVSRRRGVKGRLDVLCVLLMDCLPFKSFALDVYFLEERWKDLFLECCRKRGRESVFPECMTWKVVDSLERMPFWKGGEEEKEEEEEEEDSTICFLCQTHIDDGPIQCRYCKQYNHVLCLADKLLQSSQHASSLSLLPKQGPCPSCNKTIIWSRAMADRRKRLKTTNTQSNHIPTLSANHHSDAESHNQSNSSSSTNHLHSDQSSSTINICRSSSSDDHADDEISSTQEFPNSNDDEDPELFLNIFQNNTKRTTERSLISLDISDDDTTSSRNIDQEELVSQLENHTLEDDPSLSEEEELMDPLPITTTHHGYEDRLFDSRQNDNIEIISSSSSSTFSSDSIVHIPSDSEKESDSEVIIDLCDVSFPDENM